MNIIETKINHGFWKERKELNKNIIDLFAERMDLNNVPYPPPPAY